MNEPLAVRLLVGTLVALPALLRVAYLTGTPTAPSPGWERRPRDPQPAPAQMSTEPLDPLRRPWVARSVTVFVLATAGAALALSISAGAPRELPDVALSSPALFHLQRAAIVTAGAALLALFAVRAFAGYFPQKLSTTSAEWPATKAVAESSQAALSAASSIQDLGKVVEQLGAELASHKARQRAERDELVELLAAASNAQAHRIAALQRVVLQLAPERADELDADGE